MNVEETNRVGDEAVFLLREVSKIREKGGARFELRVPFLSAKPGEFTAVVGPSGCGKSTLLDMLGLVLQPTNAKEFLFCPGKKGGKPINISALSESKLADIRKSSIGYVLQTGGLLPFLNVRDNITLPCKLNRLTGQAHHKEVLQLVERLGITDQLSKKPQHLSGGQRQRVAIARALAFKPPFVLADEPTAAVDKLTALEIRNEFKELTGQMGVTLIMVTHNQSLVKDAADRMLTFHVEKKSRNHTISTLRDA